MDFYYTLCLWLAPSLFVIAAVLIGYGLIGEYRSRPNRNAELEGLQSWMSIYLEKTRDVPGDTLQERLDFLLLQRELLSEENPHAQ